MPQALPVIAAVSGVAGVVGQARARSEQKRQTAALNNQAAATQRSVDLQEKQQEAATGRSRRQAIRQAIVARSRAQSSAANLGASFGSGISGGLSSLGSQVGSELGFSTRMSGLSAGINAANKEAAMFGTQANNFGASAQRWSGISQLGFGMFQNLGGFNSFSGFGGNPTTPAQAGGLGNMRPVPRPT